MTAVKIAAALAALLAAGHAAAADAPPQLYPQPEQVGYQDCVTHSCKLVPEVKQIKKTVYEVQEVPYCLKKLPPLWSLFCHHGCDDLRSLPRLPVPALQKSAGQEGSRVQGNLHDQVRRPGARRACPLSAVLQVRASCPHRPFIGPAGFPCHADRRPGRPARRPVLLAVRR